MNPIVEKIQKLLSLSTSPNEHEAAAAAQKMNDLLTRHNLSLADLGSQDEEDLQQDTMAPAVSRIESWRSILYRAITELNYCEVWVRRGHLSEIVVLGRPLNVTVSKQMAEYLEVAIKRLMKEAGDRQARETGYRDRSYGNAFKLGCAARLAERLCEQRRERDRDGIAGTPDAPAVSALVCRSMAEREKVAIQRWRADQGVRLKSSNGRASCSNRDGLNDGRVAGGSVGLHGQLSGGRTRQLGAGR